MKTYDQEITARISPDEPSLIDRPEISVFLPVYNEEPNLRPLHAKMDQALKKLGRSAEIIYVDDGSTDGSLKVLRNLATSITVSAWLRLDATTVRRLRCRRALMPPVATY